MTRRLKTAAAFVSSIVFAGALSNSVRAADTVTKQYDVSDLVTPHPSHALVPEPQPAPGGTGGGGGLFQASPETADALLTTVRSALFIAPDSNAKEVQLIGSSLVVNEPAEAQESVARLLESLRSKSNMSVQISIEAVWALAPAGPLPDATALIADQNAVHARARTVGFNGQTIGVRQVREVSVITGATPVLSNNVGMNQFTTEVDRPGVQFEATPHLQSDGSIVVDVKSESTAEMPAPKLPTTRPEDFPILRPDKLIQSIATTVALKPGQPTIVGGITQDTTEPHGKTLCLVLTATVVPPPAKWFK